MALAVVSLVLALRAAQSPLVGPLFPGLPTKHRTVSPAASTSVSTPTDADWMHYALRLAERGRLSTAPNPWVGCVFVAADKRTVLAEGFHARKGGAHAEAAALADAREKGVTPEQFATATAYVTLEPCHRGPGKTTPPCDEALVACGVRHIHIALVDPDPVFGRQAGLEHLRENGVQVTVGTAAESVARSLRPYLHQRVVRRPYVVLKVASAADGAIACADGTSQWITGAEARSHSQLLRASSQAIVVGVGTAIADEPRLNLRLGKDSLPPDCLPPIGNPLRVVLDSKGRLEKGPLLDTALAPTLVCTTELAPAERREAWERRGVQVAVLPAAPGGAGVDLGAVLDELGERGIIQVMVEGGGQVLGSFLEERLAQRLRLYVGATALGSTSVRWISAPLAPTIDEAPRWKLVSTEALGDDVCIEYDIRESGTE